MPKKNHLSLFSRGLKYKLKISFYLMSILPLLISILLVSNYIFPHLGLKPDIVAFVIISIFIAVIGFLVVKEVFDRIVNVTSEAKMIAAGDISRRLDIEDTDEVGDLSASLNMLTHRIRSNMNELKSYSEKTTEINFAIQKRVIVLSSLLQISALISQGAKLEDILKLIVEKSRLLANSDLAYLFFREENQEALYMKSADGINSEYLLRLVLEPKEELFAKIIKTSKPLVVDSNNALPGHLTTVFNEKFKMKNSMILPVYLRGRIIAALGIGNNQETFIYNKEDTELLDIFAKQVAISVENDILTHKVEKLEIKDSLTGLYNKGFIYNRLDEEIKRSIKYQRPCAFIVIDIDNFKKFHDNFGSLQSESVLKRVTSLIMDSVSEVDRVARTEDDEFSILLPERNKRQAQEIAEDVRRKIEFAFSEEADVKRRITVSGGVSENPLDGIDAKALTEKAKQLVAAAKNQGRNRITGVI